MTLKLGFTVSGFTRRGFCRRKCSEHMRAHESQDGRWIYEILDDLLPVPEPEPLGSRKFSMQRKFKDSIPDAAA